MGAGASSQRQLLASLNGGRTMLAGTFVAEKSHGDPPRYTLMNVSSALEAGGGGGGSLGSANSSTRTGGTGGGTRSVALEKGSIRSSTLAALNDIEPLLIPEEPKVERPARATSFHYSGVVPKAGAQGTGTTTNVHMGNGSASVAETQGLADAIPGFRAASPNPSTARQEVFSRLASHERPWVAMKTDTQLLTYLARRSRDPQIDRPDGQKGRRTPFESQNRGKLRHNNHKELFDECLDRPVVDRPVSALAGSITCTSSRAFPARRQHKLPALRSGQCGGGQAVRSRPGSNGRLAAPCQQKIVSASRNSGCSRRRLLDEIRDIRVMPEDAVASFLQTEPAMQGPPVGLATT
eukprot:TRINITY_DN9166_c0_g1_i2.p1 TRINITY_DN9166_c0_g1~~TRINITY_DN9166_c0_g1_i2.p1  ORF type:complete len:351 (-),score=29.20 TRINITY_DN9166_c0_g1_i2:257-1309(-)